MDLNERKQKILKAIVDEYINTAEPVGSRAISKKNELGLSSATIRNEMADLERTNQVSEVLIRDILEEAAYNDDIAGLVVNPFTDGFAVYKDGIEFMLNNVDELGDLEAG